MNEEVLKRDYNTNVVYTHNFSFRNMFSDVAGYLLPTTYVTGDCVKIDTFFQIEEKHVICQFGVIEI